MSKTLLAPTDSRLMYVKWLWETGQHDTMEKWDEWLVQQENGSSDHAKELEALRKDAGRYRYLRNTEMWPSIIWEAIDYVVTEEGGSDNGAYQVALDAAVDESIKRGGK